MKFLVDKNISYRLCGFLVEAGYEACHVDDLSMDAAPDERIRDVAASEGSSSSSDTDFGTLPPCSDGRGASS